MKILVFTSVFQREAITSLHMDAMIELRDTCLKMGVEIIPFYALSDNDPLCAKWEYLCEEGQFLCMISQAKTLSDKCNEALQAIATLDWDLFMHLDSDEFLPPLWVPSVVSAHRRIRSPLKWIGCKDMVFYDRDSKEMWQFPGYRRIKCVNAGMTLSREVLEVLDWNLWRGGLERGLNYSEQIRLESAGLYPTMVSCETLLEIKQKNRQIHSTAWYQENYMMKRIQAGSETFRKVLADHPLLENLLYMKESLS